MKTEADKQASLPSIHVNAACSNNFKVSDSLSSSSVVFWCPALTICKLRNFQRIAGLFWCFHNPLKSDAGYETFNARM